MQTTILFKYYLVPNRRIWRLRGLQHILSTFFFAGSSTRYPSTYLHRLSVRLYMTCISVVIRLRQGLYNMDFCIFWAVSDDKMEFIKFQRYLGVYVWMRDQQQHIVFFARSLKKCQQSIVGNRKFHTLVLFMRLSRKKKFIRRLLYLSI